MSTDEMHLLSTALVKSANNVQSRLETFLSAPDDAESNHKFRVSIRTLRSLLDFTSRWQKAKPNKAIRRDLKEIVGRTSRLRELDVLAAQVAREAKGRDAGQAALEFCLRVAAEERAGVYAFIASSEVGGVIDDLDAKVEQIPWKKGIVRSGLSRDDVREAFDVMARELQDNLDALDYSDYEEVHAVRKQAKQVRYVAERFSGVLGDDARAAARSMKAQQDRLGEVCDAHVNVGLTQWLLDREDLPPDARSLLEAVQSRFAAACALPLTSPL